MSSIMFHELPTNKDGCLGKGYYKRKPLFPILGGLNSVFPVVMVCGQPTGLRKTS